MQSNVDKLIHATINLTKTVGLAKASTAKIAKKASVATGTLFHHFPTKQKLIEASYLSVQENYAWHLVGIFDYPDRQLESRLLKSIKAAVEYWIRYEEGFAFTRQVINSGYLGPSIQAQVDHLNQHYINAIKLGIKKKILRKDDPHLIYQLVFSTVLQTVQLFFAESDETLRKRIKKGGINYAWNAIQKVN